MKNFIRKTFILFLIVCILSVACGCNNNNCRKHSDNDQNGVCDTCHQSVFIYFDFYAIGDLANKTADTDKLSNYFKYAKQNDQNAILLSTGNMLKDETDETIDWMNDVEFSASSIGFNELSLDKDILKGAAKDTDFPLLAINIYDSKTDDLADFCNASTLVKCGDFKIGVIGAVTATENRDDIYLKTDAQLTELVKSESDALRKKGADFVVYILTGTDDLHYDETLSDGYVDLVFEGNTDKSYETKDSFGIYHLQNNDSHSVGICHAEVAFNSITRSPALRDTNLILNDVYTSDKYIPQEEDIKDENNSNDNNANNNTNSNNNSNSGNNSDDNNNNNNSGDNSNNNNNTVNSNSNDKINNSSTTNSNNTHSSNKPNSNTNNTDKNNSKPVVSSPQSTNDCKKHKDDDGNEICDACNQSVLVYIDFYNINDLHGKLDDGDGHIGVDELTTYLKNARKTDDHAFFISTGDMWQGQAESNMTKGIIMTDWMNELDFTAMAIGNHEYDWGGEYIKQNADFAEFPFLAINIYDRATNELVNYCKPSVMVDTGAVQIGFIGAIGDCYSSIAVDKCDDVYFKVGSQLTSLVKAEADELRHNGADYIVYILHDGYGSSNYGSATQIPSSQIRSYYDVALSDGYVDLVFEGHTHQGYRLIDEHGVYHIQNRGDNKGGISHAEVAINSVTNKNEITAAELVATHQYQDLDDDPIVDKLLEKYKDQISSANEVLGYNSTYRDDEELEQLVAKLYYEVGVKEWGDKYKIVLGGGFLRTRSPYNLYVGDVTYGQLSSLFTFDNQITLCAVKGRDLKRKFFETNNSDYFISYGDYGNSVRNNIDLNATYYIVVDNYTADYSYNNLTIVERYDPNVFARDLLADYIKKGGLS